MLHYRVRSSRYVSTHYTIQIKNTDVVGTGLGEVWGMLVHRRRYGTKEMPMN